MPKPSVLVEIKIVSSVRTVSAIIHIGRAPTPVGRKHRGEICGPRSEVHKGAVILAIETKLVVTGSSAENILGAPSESPRDI